jgi:hypothetical protein
MLVLAGHMFDLVQRSGVAVMFRHVFASLLVAVACGVIAVTARCC